MEQIKQVNKEPPVKSLRTIWLWAFAGFVLPFLIFLFLQSSHLGEQTYSNHLAHSILLFMVCAVAMYASHIAYKGYLENQGVNLFITSLAFYTFGFIFLLHGISIPGVGIFGEEIFDVTEHYGLFLGSLIFMGLMLPLEGIRDLIYRFKKLIILGWAIFLFVAFIILVLFPNLTRILIQPINVVIVLTIPLIIIPLIFMLFSYGKSRSGLLIFFILAFAIMINTGIVPLYYREWNLLWWYFHIVFLASYIIILVGLLRYRHRREEIVNALAKTRSKLLLIFLLIGLLPLGFFGYFNIQSGRADLEKEIRGKLAQLAEVKEGQVYAYFDSLESKTLDFSSDGFIRSNLEKINKTGSTQAVEDLNDYLVNSKQINDPTLVGILIVDLRGRVVSATDEDEIGEDESDDEYFIKGQKGIFTIEVEEESGHFGLDNPIAVAAPLTNQQTGELLGVIINTFETGKLHEILSGEFQIEKGALGGRVNQSKSMETYLVDRKKRMLSHPHKPDEKKEHEERFDLIVVDTLPVKKCLEEQEEISTKYFNYAKKEVLGASMCIAQRSWTLVVEMDIKEALSPIELLQRELIITIILFAIITSGVAIVFSTTITRPVKKLHEAAEIITDGNLDYHVNIKTGDEIEDLAEAFNKMAEKLKESYSDLEQKVEEKTKNLEEKLAELEKFKEVTVGRELKMIELKEEIQKLKKIKESKAK